MPDLKKLTSAAQSTLNRFRLEKKMAAVVGGSQGLGQAMALALAAAGADVCVVGLGGENLSGPPKRSIPSAARACGSRRT